MRSLKKAQVVFEYIIVFNVVALAVLATANEHIRPAVEKLMEKTGKMIEREVNRLTRRYE